MEWVETTGSTVEEAKDAALDQLGVDEQDAEFEILEEAKSGLFGLTRREARVRARVRPTSPRPKVERRDRRRPKADASKRSRGALGSKGSESQGGHRQGSRRRTTVDARDGPRPRADIDGGRADAPPADQRLGPRRLAAVGPRRPLAPADSSPKIDTNQEGSPMSTDDATVEQQADIIADFVEGLVEAFGLDGEVNQEKIDDETIEVQIEGDDLGLLIGPKGQTLTAIQELSRTVVQRRASGTHHGRVRLDVSGYRQRRREALERFATSVANDVRESGVQKALEPMNAADRKVVHDTVNEIDGVSHRLRGRGSAAPGRDPPRGLITLHPEGPDERISSAPASADEPLVRVLERSRELGFLGPGPVEPHIEHARRFAVAAGAFGPGESGVGSPAQALDLGSGGGLPGLVLVAAWPATRWWLLDANQRRTDFLAQAATELGVADRVTILRGRAEELAHDPDATRHVRAGDGPQLRPTRR